MEESFEKALPIIETLNAAGYEAYFVGGSVRDILLKRPIGDIDIATSALPQNVQALFKKTVPVGIEHGTVVVLINNEQYEVTTYRIEGEYKDFRRPSEVEFVTSLEADLSRRDFTINAIAMDKNGEIFDPYNGRSDLQQKYIQTVGNPDERFAEDPLRMMRAVRFISQLDFQLSKDTEDSISKNANLLKNISVERVLIEFEKLLGGVSIRRGLTMIANLDLYRYLPSLSDKQLELLKFAELFPNDLTLDETWALLILSLSIENVDQFFKNWKCSNQRIKTTKDYLRAYQDYKQKGLSPNLIYLHGVKSLLAAIKINSIISNTDCTETVQKTQEIYSTLPIYSRKELAVSGSDLLEWFNKPGGPWLSALIEMIETAVVNQKVGNSKMEIKEWLETCNPLQENEY